MVEQSDLSWDVFICHASEDKASVARPLANELAARGQRVWLDESEVHIGDSLRAKIDHGLANSRFGVVVLSPSFFAKDWTKAELGGLIAQEINQRKVILPVWHELSAGHIRRYSPILGDRLAVDTRQGLRSVAQKVVDAIKAVDPRYVPGAPIFSGRLTKKLLLGFPEGSFIMSNLLNEKYLPMLAEEIPSGESRLEYWNYLRMTKISLSKIYVFANAGEYRRHIASRSIYDPVIY